jgi:hypothetical protein
VQITLDGKFLCPVTALIGSPSDRNFNSKDRSYCALHKGGQILIGGLAASSISKPLVGVSLPAKAGQCRLQTFLFPILSVRHCTRMDWQAACTGVSIWAEVHTGSERSPYLWTIRGNKTEFGPPRSFSAFFQQTSDFRKARRAICRD